MNSMLGLAVGICGAAFIGYCIYFDNKRRSDPNFRKRLRERRKQAREEAFAIRSQIPPLKDSDAIQKFFLQEVQMGEELLSQGDVVSGVEHLANAVAVCGQPQHLLSILSTTLPPQVFQMLVQHLSCMKRQVNNRPENE
ncbi:UNVERIFIED_CONTAM: hypothetical protein PYX00_006313 [Menopon gallinae]|uniref:Mitochondrial import receptor subunit TOM20 homolog n=1 Tax=Menopon gallinae TaxID=328185 RepID=A0AAW2HV85_9NEOP